MDSYNIKLASSLDIMKQDIYDYSQLPQVL